MTTDAELIRGHLKSKGEYEAPLRPRRTASDIRAQARIEERAYARKCIRTIWIVAALITAMFAWTARQPPFAIPAPLIQVLAVSVNGIVWWLATSRIWFRAERRR